MSESSESLQFIDNRQKTFMIAQEIGILPTTKVYRWMHPVMVCGIENGRLLLVGNKENGTRVLDKYGSTDVDLRANDLKNPGLNFIVDYSDHYRSGYRRMAVSLRMDEQAEELQIYPDVGSEVKSVYYTNPEGTVFRVGAERIDPLEVGIALKVRASMDRLRLREEPGYKNWMESDIEGVRVITYLPKPGKGEQKIEVAFIRDGDSFRVNNPFPDGTEMSKLIEEMAIYRLLLENREFNRLVRSDGSINQKDELIDAVTQAPEFPQISVLS